MIKSDYLENSNEWFFGLGLYGHLIFKCKYLRQPATVYLVRTVLGLLFVITHIFTYNGV